MNHDLASLEDWLNQAQQGDAIACYNAGFIFQERGDITNAIAYYEKAIELNALLFEAYNNLGGIYKANEESEKALDCYMKALYLNPNVANVNNNIGVILQNKKNFKEALRFLNKALYLDPLCATTHYNMGLTYEDQTMFAKAVEHYEKAYSLDPASAVPFYWSLQLTNIQRLYLENADHQRALDKLKVLSEWAHVNHVMGEKVIGFSTPFYVTYRETNNRQFFSTYGDMCVSLMQYMQQPIPPMVEQRSKIRIGVVCDHFHGHSVWYAVLKGWYQHINKNQFEFYSFSLGKKKDDETEIAKQQSAYFVEGNYDASQWRDVIMAQQLDVLIFSAVGMDWKIQQLGSIKMAPVQLTTWGHPETSGLPTIDYYLSADDFEPVNAQENYRETLVRLPNLGSCYEPLQLRPDEFNIADVGVDSNTCLLIAPGTPFKYEQQYDYIFAEIAARAPNAKIIFFKLKPEGLSELFEERIKQSFGAKGLVVSDHVIFIPAMRKSRFHALMKQAHVYLDTIGFSGFNSAMQGIECGLPIVTYEGQFMRGRFGSAILRKIGMEELVTQSVEAYIEKAVRLANDDVYRVNVKNKIKTSAPALYSDVSVVKALETFITSIVNR